MCVEMEKEEQTGIEEQEQEEITMLRRKSPRTGNDIKIIEIDSVNEITEKNGSIVTENGAENQNSAHEIEDKIKKLNGFLENEPEEKTGEQKSENIVFYDRDEGVNFASEYSGDEKIEKDTGDDKWDISSHDLKKSTEIHTEYFEDKSSSSPNIQPSQSLFQEKHTGSKEMETEDDVGLINEDELEVTEFDVEKVLTKQTTHDLYCPNCNSCITKRVILRKRKRRSRVSEEEFKRNKIEAIVDHVQASSDQVDGVGTRVLTVEDEEDHGREPDLFRCLSCFSFFIPSGDGFKMFRIFGEKSRKENVQDKQVSSVKKNWFTSMFVPNKQGKASERGSNVKTEVQTSNIGISGQPLLIQEETHSISSNSHGILSVPRNNNATQEPAINGKLVNGAGDLFNKTTKKIDGTVGNIYQRGSEQLKESMFGKEAIVGSENNVVTAPLNMTQVGNGELTDDSFSFSFSPGGLKFMNSSNKGSSTTENSKEAEISNQTSQLSDTELTESEDTEGKLSISVAIPSEEQHVGAYIVTESVENRNTSFKSSDIGEFYPSEVSQQIITTSKYEVHTGETLQVDNFSSVTGFSVAQGKDTVITIESRPGQAESSQNLQGTGLSSALQSEAHIISRECERSEVRNKIEVIKSIVYGGLAESITSLSVVSSAAGGGAATLNILALGMANLFGGFLILCHNLWELRCERAESQVSNQITNQVTEQKDRYREFLGRRENFVLHAVVAIISYIIFGLVPPVVYGFSFRTSNDKELKLLAVAASSLLCILILAICRAYVCRLPKPYLKSALTFVILGIMVSGVSYAGGVLVERLLEKLRLFEPGSTPDKLLVPGMKGLDLGWASY